MNFKQILEKHGVSAAELSRRSGVAASTVSKFANGRSRCENMPIGTFFSICRGLGVSAGELIVDLFGDRGDEYRVDVGSSLTPTEDALVNDYRYLNEEAKKCLLRVANSMTVDPVNHGRDVE